MVVWPWGLTAPSKRTRTPELVTKFASEPSVAELFKKCDPESGCNALQYIQVDVARSDCGAVLSEALARAGIVPDVAIYAAASGWVGPIVKETEETIRSTIATNFTGFTLVAKHLAKAMLAGTEGGPASTPPKKTKKIVVLSSVQATRATPMFATYTATKAAVDSFAWSLNTELASTPVAVQTIHPGATQTGFFEKCGVPAGAFDTSKFADPAHVARSVLHDVSTSLELCETYGTFNEKWMMLAGWALPLSYWAIKTYAGIPGAFLSGIGRTFRKRTPGDLFGSEATPAFPANAVVTGGADGLGRAFVEILASERNCRIVSCDIQRGAPLPDAMPQQLLRNVTIDLQPAKLAGRIQEMGLFPEGEGVDLLVLNAAVNHARPATQAQHIDLPDNAIVQTAEVNLVAPLVLATMSIRHNMALSKPPPTTLFLCSLSTWFSYPGSAAYGASKDGLVSYSKSMRRFAGNAANVLCAFPGPMRTKMAADSAPENTEARVNGRMPASKAAEIILSAAANGDSEVVVAGPVIKGMVKKAAWNAAWAANLMRTWQFEPSLNAKVNAKV